MRNLFKKLFGKKQLSPQTPGAVKNEASGRSERNEPASGGGAFEAKVKAVSCGNSKTHALGVTLLEAANDGNEGELDRCLRELPSTGTHHGAHLTPLINAAFDLLDEKRNAAICDAAQDFGVDAGVDSLVKFQRLESKLNDWKLRFLDTLDGLPEPLDRMPLAGNYLALMHMPGMPHSSCNYHLVTVWFDDGTAIRHARVFNRTEMEVPAAWNNKRICNMAFLMDQP